LDLEAVMAPRRASVPGRRLLHPRWQQRERRITATRAVREALVSLAGLLGGVVRNQAGEEVGRLVDVVARWADEPYPPVTGLVVRVARRQVFVAADQVVELDRRGVRLRSARLDLREVERRPGEVLLARDVLDHQLVDTDGIKVIRAADLYLARVGEVYRLVGVDVGLQTLLRRLGPARFRWLPTPDRVIDWAAVQPLNMAGSACGPRRSGCTVSGRGNLPTCWRTWSAQPARPCSPISTRP
jgi:hypothetical protein